MDLLEFGMRNEKDGSLFCRMLARLALAAERKRADLCECRLNKKEISFPDDPDEDAALLKNIREQIDARDTH